MDRKRLSKLTALAAAGTLAVFGAACEAEGGGTSPGQEVPADGGLGDTGGDTGGGLGDTGGDF